jgi:hypothetical protein
VQPHRRLADHAIGCYWRAVADGIDAISLIGSLVLGAALMANSIVLLKI